LTNSHIAVGQLVGGGVVRALLRVWGGVLVFCGIVDVNEAGEAEAEGGVAAGQEESRRAQAQLYAALRFGVCVRRRGQGFLLLRRRGARGRERRPSLEGREA